MSVYKQRHNVDARLQLHTPNPTVTDQVQQHFVSCLLSTFEDFYCLKKQMGLEKQEPLWRNAAGNYLLPREKKRPRIIPTKQFIMYNT